MSPTSASPSFPLTRQSAFSYHCNQCSRCCYDKTIQLNPYEVARLAHNRGMSTTDLIRRYTDASGAALKRTDAGACVFLTSEGCGVHPDRPLVCRLYPLGRHIKASGEERFSEVTPHPQSEGIYGKDKTVADYLETQGAEPFIQAVDRYLDLLGRMAIALRKSLHAASVTQGGGGAAVISVEAGSGAPEWLDMDSVVSNYCKQRGLSEPDDPIDKMAIHVRAIETWLDTLS